MKLIVGLGNPGKEYEKTRHNLGFLVIDEILNRKGIELDKEKFNGLYTIDGVGNNRVIYAKPMTFMNLSGSFVQDIMSFYKIDIEDVLVLVDDKDMEVGKLKIKTNGSSAGQNGIKDIINKLGTEEFARAKLGIGSDSRIQTKDYVLGKWNKEQAEIIGQRIKHFGDAAIAFENNDISTVMNKYNGK